MCWAAFIAIQRCMWPEGCRLDTPARPRNSQQRQLSDTWPRMQGNASPKKMHKQPVGIKKIPDTISHQEMPTTATRSHCGTPSAERISTKKKCSEKLGPTSLLILWEAGSSPKLKPWHPADPDIR